jgi:Mce-associated membrane protein
VTRDDKRASRSPAADDGLPDRETSPGHAASPDHAGLPNQEEMRAHGSGRLRGWAAADPLRATSIAVTVIAALCAAWFGGSWLIAANSGSPAYSQTRDTVLEAAEQEVVNLNTLNYHHARQDLQLWLASSTASLRSGLAQNLQQEAQITEHDKLITNATILDGAVTRLDTGEGTASVMVALTFTVTVSGGPPATKFQSELGQLTKTSSGWKLSSLCPTSGCNSSLGASPSPGPSASPTPTS